MKYLKNSFFFLVIFSFSSGQVIFAQDSKLEQQTIEASKIRFKIDMAHAESKREAYNRSSWIGGKLSALIASWGPPTRIITDGADGQIAVYDDIRTYQTGSYTPGSMTTGTNGFGQTVVLDYKAGSDTREMKTNQKLTTIYVDKENIITRVEFKQNIN